MYCRTALTGMGHMYMLKPHPEMNITGLLGVGFDCACSRSVPSLGRSCDAALGLSGPNLW
jgi:hypothetical protein